MNLLPTPMPPVARAGVGAATGAPWSELFARRHAVWVAGALLLCSIIDLMGPSRLLTDGGAVLLVGGALIGLPHGSADFAVAARWMQPAFRRSWLPLFLVGYLITVAAVLFAWAIVPLATLMIFLIVSACHFGGEDIEDASPRWRSVVFLARATTPLVPIFLVHGAAVAPYLAALGGQGADNSAALLATARPVGLALWSALLVAGIVGEARGDGRAALPRAGELAAVAIAAVVLPPLAAFGLYFCLIHALRHMAHLAGDTHPHAPRQALRLCGTILLPSAAVCLVVLGACWSTVGGWWPTPAVITGGLRVVAALTAPHMLLEWLSRRPLRFPAVLSARAPAR